MDYDMDAIPTCDIAPFIALDGRKQSALVCRKGYSFSRIDTWIEEVFASEAGARAYIGECGKTRRNQDQPRIFSMASSQRKLSLC